MHELYLKILAIHPDTDCVRIADDGEAMVVFPMSEAEKDPAWVGKKWCEMVWQEFIPGSPTYLWFGELYDYLEECEANGNPILPGDYR